jgi:hypothetical protein
MGSGGGSSGGVVGAAMDAWTGMTARERRKQWEAEEGNRLVSKNGLFKPLMYKTNILPRQARDKHRESTQKRTVCPQESTGTCTALPDCQQIWTRNLSNGDVALTFVNYTQVLVCENNGLFLPFLHKRTFYQDRLGTDIGKSTQNKRPFCCRRRLRLLSPQQRRQRTRNCVRGVGVLARTWCWLHAMRASRSSCGSSAPPAPQAA